LLNNIGFIISTALFLVISMTICGERSFIKTLISSLLFTFFIYFIFRILLKTPLPEGFLETILENYF
jgi:hypothetical protein